MFESIATRCPRCKVEQNYLNVLVAHVLLDQCRDTTPSINVNERLFVPGPSAKSFSMDFSLARRPSSPSPPAKPIVTEKQKDENIKEKHDELPNPIAFSTNDVSSYKMSVLDGTHALEFTSLDNDGRQRKAHLCLFCGKVISHK